MTKVKEAYDVDDRHERVALSLKRTVDLFLLPVVLLIPVYLYLLLFAPSDHVLSPAKPYLQVILLGYFVLELLLSFVLYRSSVQFVHDRWVDILLTVPLFTALKGGKAVLAGLKFAKSGKLIKAGKATQKSLKAVVKGEKISDKQEKKATGSPDGQGKDAEASGDGTEPG